MASRLSEEAQRDVRWASNVVIDFLSSDDRRRNVCHQIDDTGLGRHQPNARASRNHAPFYAQIPARFGLINPDAADSAAVAQDP